ncbi:MAG: VWA domain-containing protein [Bacteroidota bacterium]
MAHFQYLNNLVWLLAALPVIGFYLGYEHWKKTVKKKAGNPKLISLMMIGTSEKRNRVKAGIFVLAIVLLAIAMLNYQKPLQQPGGGLKGIDIMIALDVSNSMKANDVSPNRLERARLLAARLIDTLQGNRVGIVAFAGDAYLQLPLTTDLTAARLYLQSVSTGLVPNQGTNIYNALHLINESMDPAAHQYKAVLLVTDGEELDEKAMDAAKELKEAGVVILPVGIGTQNGATLPGENGGIRRDEKGEPVISKLNDQLLKDLAAETSGTYRLMGETSETLNAIVTELKTMDQKPISNATMVNYKSYSPWLIALALVLLIFEFLLPAKVNPASESAKRIVTPAVEKMTLLFMLLFAGNMVNAQSTRMLLHKANEAYRQNQYDEAEKLYQSVLKNDPANNVAKYNLGNIAYRRKQYEEAVKTYDDVTAQKQETTKAAAGAWNNKGLSFVQQKDLPKAIESFKESIRKNPFDEEVRNNLMKALQEQQQQQKQDKPDSNKQQSPKPKPQNQMKKKDAEEKMAALRQEEKKIRDKMKQPVNGNTSDKEW